MSKDIRVRFAKDVLALISDEAIDPEWCGYLNIKLPNKVNRKEELSSVLEDAIGHKKTQITVCALGSLFVAAVLRKDDLKIKELVPYDTKKKLKLLSAGHFEVYSYLESFFEEQQLKLIEAAYEGHTGLTVKGVVARALDFGDQYQSPRKRLKVIMKNIIEHDGLFVP